MSRRVPHELGARLARRLAEFVADEPYLTDAAALAHESGCRILLVGGAVRDLALGRPLGDLDFILDGPARRFLPGLSRLLGHRVVTFRKRGIVDHRIRAGNREWDLVERGDRSLRREILRRDFSLNAIAYDLLGGEILDPGGGLEDLRQMRIRALSSGIFTDDPLRMLRAVRLQAEIGRLSIERRTAALIRLHAPRLARVSPERLKSEMDRILAAPRPSAAVRRLESLGLLECILPELDPLRGLRQNRYHHLDAFRHTLEALSAADDTRRLARGLPTYVFLENPLGGEADGTLASAGVAPHGLSHGLARTASDPAQPSGQLPPHRARLLRWALLLHDTGKAETRAMGDDGDYTFYLHDQVSARIARQVLRRLRASRAEIAAVERLAFLHLRLSIPASGEMTPRAFRRIVRDAGGLTPLLVLHSLADKIASRGTAHARTLAALRRAGRQLLEVWRAEAERAARAPRLLTGHDVMKALGLAPGPTVGALLAEAEELQASGDLRTREEAFAWLAQRHSSKS